MKPAENKNKTWIVVGIVVLALTVTAVSIALRGSSQTKEKEKEKEKSKDTTKTGGVVRNAFYALMVGVFGYVAAKIGKSNTVKDIRKKRILDQDETFYKAVYLSKLYPKNDLMLLAAGIYWYRKFPSASDVFDTLTYPTLKKLAKQIKDRIPVDQLKDDQAVLRQVEEYLQTHYTKQLKVFTQNEERIIQIYGDEDSCLEYPCLPLFLNRNTGHYGVLIRTASKQPEKGKIFKLNL